MFLAIGQLIRAIAPECGAPEPVATSPCTIPPGRLQAEGDFLSIEIDCAGSALAVGPVFLKAPLTQATQIEAGISPMMWKRPSAGAWGKWVANWPKAASLRVKHNILATDRISVAMHPGLELPLGGRPVGLVIGLPTAIALRHSRSITFNPEIRLSRATPGEFRNAMSLSSALNRERIAVVSLVSAVPLQGSPFQALAFSLDYTPARQPDLHLDIGLAGPDGRLFVGFSRRF